MHTEAASAARKPARSYPCAEEGLGYGLVS